MDDLEFDLRQLNLMSVSIDQYKEGIIELYSLVNNLQSLAGYLKVVSDEKREDLISHIGNIDIIYGVASNEKRSPNTAEKEFINEYILKIEKIIKELNESNNNLLIE